MKTFPEILFIGGTGIVVFLGGALQWDYAWAASYVIGFVLGMGYGIGALFRKYDHEDARKAEGQRGR